MSFHLPPEWHPQQWLWVGFPHDPVEWPGFLGRAQEQIAAFANAVAESGQEVRLIVRDEANEARARALVSSAVKLERRVYGDIWLRDTGPLVVSDGASEPRYYVLANTAGGRFEGDDLARVVRFAGDVVEVDGTVAGNAGLPTLRVDVSTLRRL